MSESTQLSQSYFRVDVLGAVRGPTGGEVPGRGGGFSDRRTGLGATEVACALPVVGYRIIATKVDGN